MINNNNLDKELSNSTKKLIKVACYIAPVLFSIYAIAFNSDIAALLIILVGIPLCAMAFSIKITKSKFSNNTIIFNSFSNKRKATKGIFSPFTLYFIGIVLILGSFIGSFDGFRTPLIMSGIATILFNLARKRRN
jgi:hypothetical protein